MKTLGKLLRIWPCFYSIVSSYSPVLISRMVCAHIAILKKSGGELTTMENQTHKGNYKGTTHMNAKNQDMAFVNDTVEGTKSTSNFTGKKKKTD